ncbi:MAG: cell division protein ZapA [Deltaproteobacteria bacterium]|nr:cell division protein ZapA [Deltaproteobacteria bacterium]
MDKPGARRQMEVTMVGQKFKVRSDADESYVQTLAAYVDKKIADISKQTRTVTTRQVVLLAALDIADEYFRAHQKLKTLRHEVRRRSRRLLDMLENSAAHGAAE